jgi:hypothetical protein
VGTSRNDGWSGRASWLATGLATALAVSSAGCPRTPDPGPSADPSDVTPVPSTQPTLAVEIGTGQESFTPLADDDLVDVVTGPQGGQHIWTAVRVHGVPPDGLRVNVSGIVTDDTTPLGPASGWAGPWTTVGDAAELDGMRAYVDYAPSGTSILLEVQVIAADGRHGEDHRTVRVR